MPKGTSTGLFQYGPLLLRRQLSNGDIPASASPQTPHLKTSEYFPIPHRDPLGKRPNRILQICFEFYGMLQSRTPIRLRSSSVLGVAKQARHTILFTNEDLRLLCFSRLESGHFRPPPTQLSSMRFWKSNNAAKRQIEAILLVLAVLNLALICLS